MKIAWIGTGVMGAPMAKHLAKAGHKVNAYNRTFEKAKACEPELNAYETIEECVKDVDAVFTIVGYPKDVEEVYTKLYAVLKPGCICVDMTTSSPKLAKKLAEKAKEKGIIQLDAPVTGGDLGAINATLSIMVGGEESAYQTLYPLFEVMGKTITYVGQAGNGQYAKLANQTAIAGSLLGLAEALSFAKSHGLSGEAVLRILNGGSASSWQSINNGPKILEEDFRPGFFIKHFLKDLRLVLDENVGVDLAVVGKAAAVYEQLVKDGLENAGTQAVIAYYTK